MATSRERDEIGHIFSTYFTYPMDKEYDHDVLKKLKEFEVKDTDVFLIGHPKTGTTWAQEMIWLIGNDLNFEGAKAFVDERFPVLELFAAFANVQDPNVPICHSNSLEFAKNMKSPRFIKSHLRSTYLPASLVDGTVRGKIIYMARDAKDTCLSMYHYFKLLTVYNGSFEDFCKVFMSGRIAALGPYWEHILPFWNRRHENNVMFLKYSDMKKNLREVIRRVATFLDKNLTEEQVTTLTEWLDFNTMKKNPAVNHTDVHTKDGFIRSGKVGSYKEEMSQEIIDKFEDWTQVGLLGSELKL